MHARGQSTRGGGTHRRYVMLYVAMRSRLRIMSCECVALLGCSAVACAPAWPFIRVARRLCRGIMGGQWDVFSCRAVAQRPCSGGRTMMRQVEG
jgi:hypothetical protein